MQMLKQPELLNLWAYICQSFKIGPIVGHISDQYCHHRSDNYTILLRYVSPRILEQVVLASAVIDVSVLDYSATTAGSSEEVHFVVKF